MQEPKAATDGKPQTRRVTHLVVVAFVLLLLVPVGPIFLPARDTPRVADVILVLGPATEPRLALAEQLLDEGYSTRLIISAPHYGAGKTMYETALCVEPQEYRVTCKQSDPFTTQGEIGMLSEQASKNSWRSAIIITDEPHVQRARLYAQRCFAGEATVLGDGSELRPTDAIYEYAYQSAAFLKAFSFTPGCA